MFPNYDHGRFSVIDDGTLVIESVMKEDAGEYVCKGLSIAGSAYAKARLDVRGMTSQGSEKLCTLFFESVKSQSNLVFVNRRLNKVLWGASYE